MSAPLARSTGPGRAGHAAGQPARLSLGLLAGPPPSLLLCAPVGVHQACRRRGGFCTFGRCRFPTRPVGRCSTLVPCCRR
uniref:Beta-defensin-like domain-containing protein n=1 Tax=Anas platyrhynchos platyrhynchos TaxID=8840 RepID=A0A493TPJ0_ANAPP